MAYYELFDARDKAFTLASDETLFQIVTLNDADSIFFICKTSDLYDSKSPNGVTGKAKAALKSKYGENVIARFVGIKDVTDEFPPYGQTVYPSLMSLCNAKLYRLGEEADNGMLPASTMIRVATEVSDHLPGRGYSLKAEYLDSVAGEEKAAQAWAKLREDILGGTNEASSVEEEADAIDEGGSSEAKQMPAITEQIETQEIEAPRVVGPAEPAAPSFQAPKDAEGEPWSVGDLIDTGNEDERASVEALLWDGQDWQLKSGEKTFAAGAHAHKRLGKHYATLDELIEAELLTLFDDEEKKMLPKEKLVAAAVKASRQDGDTFALKEELLEEAVGAKKATVAWIRLFNGLVAGTELAAAQSGPGECRFTEVQLVAPKQLGAALMATNQKVHMCTNCGYWTLLAPPRFCPECGSKNSDYTETVAAQGEN